MIKMKFFLFLFIPLWTIIGSISTTEYIKKNDPSFSLNLLIRLLLGGPIIWCFSILVGVCCPLIFLFKCINKIFKPKLNNKEIKDLTKIDW